MKHWLKTSVWAFPVLLFIALLLLTALKFSGSSVGSYYPVLYGNNSKDPNLILNHPRPVRSDEWLVGTQEIAAQYKSGFHKVDPLMGSGANISLQSEIPSKDWSTLFKPQNWSFLVLPFEQAFAFKWWLLMYALIVSCYFFTLRLLPDKKLFAMIFGIAAGLSPFALWWYQTSIFAGLAYGFWAIILGVRILNGERIRFIKDERISTILQILALGFIGACFGLILYPPFQIPIAIVIIAYLLGHLINKLPDKKTDRRVLAKRVGYLVAAGAISAIVGLAFITSNRATIHKLTGTIYPGHRTVASGDLKILSVLDGFLMPVLQSDSRGAHFFTNPSEASNFILVMPFLLLPAFAILSYEYKKFRRMDWTMLAMSLCGLVFLLRGFVPFGNVAYKLLLLDKVPNKRLVIGMGFLGLILFIQIVRKLSGIKIRQSRLLSWSLLYGLACFAVLLVTGWYVRENYPMFLHNLPIMIFLAGAFTSIIVALLANRPLVATSFLLIFTLASGFKVIPLYHGLGFVAHNDVAQAMDNVSPAGSKWVSLGNIYFENLPLLAGRNSIGGTQIYPNLELWRQAGGTQYDYVYNREGHALFSDDSSISAPFKLIQADAYYIKFECSPFIKKNVDFAASDHKVDLPCVNLVKTVPYPNTTFYLYKITPTSQ